MKPKDSLREKAVNETQREEEREMEKERKI
jgi:hypothetical protein